MSRAMYVVGWLCRGAFVGSVGALICILVEPTTPPWAVTVLVVVAPSVVGGIGAALTYDERGRNQ